MYLQKTSDLRTTAPSAAAPLPHNDVGNLVTDPSGSYTYTPFNRLETATVGGRTATGPYGGDNGRAMRGWRAVRQFT